MFGYFDLGYFQLIFFVFGWLVVQCGQCQGFGESLFYGIEGQGCILIVCICFFFYFCGILFLCVMCVEGLGFSRGQWYLLIEKVQVFIGGFFGLFFFCYLLGIQGFDMCLVVRVIEGRIKVGFVLVGYGLGYCFLFLVIVYFCFWI